MNIAIDLSIFRSYQGTEVYAEHLVGQLIKSSTEHQFFICKNKDMFPELDRIAEKHGHVQIILNHKNKKISSGIVLALYEQCVLPFRLWIRNIDIVFSPSPFIPICAPGKKIVTIHDAAYKKFKEFRNVLSRAYINTAIAFAGLLRGGVVTVSFFSKKELTDLYGLNPSIIYGATPALPNPDPELLSAVKKKFSIGDKFFISIGSPRPRKNIKRVLSAFKAFHERYPEYQLVIVGKEESCFMDFSFFLQDFPRGSVVITGFISNEEKACLYYGSRGMVFASLYEGFGLSILEAQSLGVPVLTSKCASMPEVAGDGAVLVDPYSVIDIVNGLETIAFDESVRQKIVSSGYQNIQKFSWDKSAKELMRLLMSV